MERLLTERFLLATILRLDTKWEPLVDTETFMTLLTKLLLSVAQDVDIIRSTMVVQESPLRLLVTA